MPSQKQFILFMPSTIFLILVLLLSGGDVKFLFKVATAFLYNADLVLTILSWIFVLGLAITLGITYILYLSLCRKEGAVAPLSTDTPKGQSASTEEVNALKRISYYYLYAFASVGLLWLLQYAVDNLYMGYVSVLIPVALMFVLFRNLNDQRHLLLFALIMACFDFLMYISFDLFDVEFLFVYIDPHFLNIDLFLFIEFLPLILLLTFFIIQASSPTFRWVYGLLVVPLVVGIFAPLLTGYYEFLGYTYSSVFETFTLVAYFETRRRMLPVRKRVINA